MFKRMGDLLADIDVRALKTYRVEVKERTWLRGQAM